MPSSCFKKLVVCWSWLEEVVEVRGMAFGIICILDCGIPKYLDKFVCMNWVNATILHLLMKKPSGRGFFRCKTIELGSHLKLIIAFSFKKNRRERSPEAFINSGAKTITLEEERKTPFLRKNNNKEKREIIPLLKLML